MSRKQIFNNAQVTVLMKRYTRHKNDLELRNQIICLSLPLIDAALAKQGMYIRPELRPDVRQECALKLLKAIPKFNAKRGNAFDFCWTTICNMSKSINERLNRPVLSLSTDEETQREAESRGKNLFQTPENQHILNSISKDLEIALNRNRFRFPKNIMQRKASRILRHYVHTGELFFNKSVVVEKLKEVGLDRKQIQFCIEYSLVLVRQKLLEAKENANAISYPQIGSIVSSISDRGDI